MDNNARTPLKFRCIKCGTIWKQHADKSWSLFDQYQKPEQCCDNSTDFLSVLEPYDKVSQGLDDFLALEHPLRELSNARTPITEGLYCKVCERDYYVPDDLEDTGICDRCAQTEVTRLETELAAANERLSAVEKERNSALDQCTSLHSSRAEQIEQLNKLLEPCTYIDSYGVPGSDFQACRICDGSNQPGMLAIKDWHRQGCVVPQMEEYVAAIRAQMDTTHKD